MGSVDVDSITELLNKIVLNNFDIGSNHWVDVTHINNPHSFYVRPTAYRMHMSALHAREGPIDPCKLQPMTPVVYKSKLLGTYVRGQILFIDKCEKNIQCDIYAPDVGFIEKSIKIKRIFTPHHNQNVPPLATHCQLADCYPKGEEFNEKAIDAMKCYVGTERAKIFIRGNTPDKLVVELINTCPDDIATLLALTGYTVIGSGNNMISRFNVPQQEKHFYTYKKLTVGDVLHVRVQSGKCLKQFYVAQVDDYKEYLKERDDFTYFCKSQRPLCEDDMVEDKAVGIQTDFYSKYERGIIKEVITPDTKAKVQLVDWGNSIHVDVSRMKPLMEKFFMNPAIAIFCSADESQVWDNGLQRFLYPGYEFLITVKKVAENLQTPNIVQISPLRSN